jgi:hypothetical protein
MSRQSGLVILSLLLLVLSRTAPAQQIAAAPPRDENPTPAIEKKAVDLLETISEQVTSLHLPTNRIRSECVIADLLWKRDEKRARALFKTASDDMVGMIADIDLGEQDIYPQLTWLSQLRSEMANRLAAHDPEAAIAFVRATHINLSSDPRTKWFAEMETNLELQLAATIAKQNPTRSLEIARATLARGVSYGLMSLLNQLQVKDPKAAQTLYKEMVEQIKRTDLERNYELTNVAWNLLYFQPPQANEDIYRDLIGALVTSALAITPTDQNSINVAQNIYGQMPSLMPLIEKYAPARAASLRQWSQNVERTFDPSSRMYQELNRVSQNGTVDDILALAPRYSGEVQNQVYQQAIWKALASGDANRARQIAMDLISDPFQQRQMLNQIENQSIETAINEEKIVEVRQMLGRMKIIERRVQILTRLAGARARKGDKKGALELLNEARTATDAAPAGSGQLMAQLQIAQSYSSLDPDQSFAIIQPLIVRTNELIAAATVLDGFDFRYLKEGEWISPGANTLGNLVNNINLTLSMLAAVDFDRARGAAEQIDRRELRLSAELEIARAALSGRTTILPIGGRQYFKIERRRALSDFATQYFAGSIKLHADALSSLPGRDFVTYLVTGGGFFGQRNYRPRIF